MPIRIHDIAKKLGLESKQVLAKGKELGISAARVASSQIDEVTAQQCSKLSSAIPEPDLAMAARLYREMMTSPEFPEFLTLAAYQHLD